MFENVLEFFCYRTITATARRRGAPPVDTARRPQLQLFSAPSNGEKLPGSQLQVLRSIKIPKKDFFWFSKISRFSSRAKRAPLRHPYETLSHLPSRLANKKVLKQKVLIKSLNFFRHPFAREARGLGREAPGKTLTRTTRRAEGNHQLRCYEKKLTAP